MDILSGILPWIIPPLAGAVIGFITNHIAIKMLFRPLEEKKIFGLKLPFTPGIIPKQRYRLAESIGDMVSRELITSDAVNRQLESPSVKKSIKKGVSGLTASILEIPMTDLAQKNIPFADKKLSELLEDLFSVLFKARSFRQTVKAVLQGFLAQLAERRMGDFFSGTNASAFLAEKISGFLSDSNFAFKLSQVLEEWINRHTENNSKIGDLITDEAAVMATKAFRAILPLIESALIKWLEKPEVRSTIEIKGKLILDEILAKLNLFQRFFVSVGQYDKTLSEKMSEIIESLVQHLAQIFENAENRDAVVSAFSNAVDSLRKKEINSFLKEHSIDPAEKISVFVPSLMEFIKRNQIGEKIAGGMVSFLLNDENESIGDAAYRLLGLTPDRTAEIIVNMIENPEFEKRASMAMTSLLTEYLQKQGDLTLAGFFSVTEETKQKIDEKAVYSLQKLLSAHIPGALESLNVRSLVINKINELNVESVENLLLMVISRHLKWINVFGAILGALIGFVQIVIYFFRQ